MKFNLTNVKRVCEESGAQQDPVEAYCLIRQLSKNPPRIILEIGVYKGGMCALLQTFFPTSQVIGIEILPIDNKAIYPDLKNNIKKYGFTVHHGNSHDKQTVKEVMETIDNKADFLFIDGSHDYDSVKEDFDLWSPYVGTVGFHDLLSLEGVYKFWKELNNHPRTAAIWKETDSLGIGLIYK